MLEKTFINGKFKAWIFDHEIKKIKKIHEENLGTWQKNLNPNAYIYALAETALTSGADLRYKYVALSSYYDEPQKTDTLLNELGRVAPISITRVNNKITIDATFGTSEANTLKANITTVTDRKNFILSSKTGLLVGDRVKIILPNNPQGEQRKISFISSSSNAITINKEVSENPSISASNNFNQMISRVHLIYGSTATLSSNSGEGCSIAKLLETKNSTQTLYTRHEITFGGS